MINYLRYTPEEIVLISTVFGLLLASKLDVNGQNVIGNALVTVSQVLLVIAAQTQAIEEQRNDDSKNGCSSDDLQRQIDELKKQMDKLKNC